MLSSKFLIFLIDISGGFMDDDQVKLKLSNFLKESRDRLSYREFSKLVNIKYSTLRSWEEMESFPTIKNLELLAAYKGWTLVYFLQYLGFDLSPEVVLDFISRTYSKEDRIKLARMLLDFEE